MHGLSTSCSQHLGCYHQCLGLVLVELWKVLGKQIFFCLVGILKMVLDKVLICSPGGPGTYEEQAGQALNLWARTSCL